METKRKKRFFANHSKSSAAVISIALHLVLLLIAGTFVAVTVVTKADKQFEAPKVNRPRLPPKKLQVPVKMKKKRPKPKLRKQITVKTRMDRKMPDIKMPEISGIKGGLGSVDAAGLGGAAGVGFSMPEIEVFGVKSRGEKVFIALDSDAIMMRDEVGGMRAYTIIKNEVKNIIGKLGPTTLFNLAVFDHSNTATLFPRMVPATKPNVAKVDAWLDPLNKVTKGMGDKDYGPKTLGKGGTRVSVNDLVAGKIRRLGKDTSTQYWYNPAALAMKQQADTVFILTGWWGVLRYAEKERPVWSESHRKKWNEYLQKGREKLAQENKERAARGEPPKVLRDQWHIVREYYPSQYVSYYPPQPPWYYYTPRDYTDALKIVRKESASKLPVKSGISKKKKDSYSLNIIFFARKDDADAQAREIEKFTELARRNRGKFRSIAGLEAIQSSVSGK